MLGERWGLELEKNFSGKRRLSELRERVFQDLDFQSQSTVIHDLIAKLCPGDLCCFYPKYHCEFSPIEHFWCDHKAYCRSNLRLYNIVGLRRIIPRGLDAVCGDCVRRHFGHCRRYEMAYRKAGECHLVADLVKATKYASHRRVSTKKAQELGEVQAEEFSGLCSCSKCNQDAPPCTSPLCRTHTGEEPSSYCPRLARREVEESEEERAEEDFEERKRMISDLVFVLDKDSESGSVVPFQGVVDKECTEADSLAYFVRFAGHQKAFLYSSREIYSSAEEALADVHFYYEREA